MRTPTTNASKSLVLHVRLGCGSLSITTPVSCLANKLDVLCALHDVRSVLHERVSLATVYQSCVINDAMNAEIISRQSWSKVSWRSATIQILTP